MKSIALLLVMFFFTHSAFANEPMSPGDVVKITVSNNPDLMVESKLDNSGVLNFPLIGSITLEGMTTKEAGKLISHKLVSDGYLRKADVNVSVVSSVKSQVSVLGNIAKPGKYQVEPGVETVLDLLAVAGGVMPGGSMVVTLVRVNDSLPKRFKINVEDILLKKSAQEIVDSNISLKGGDVLYVPDQAVFYSLGEVARPGAYPVKGGVTVRQALSLSGGVTPSGDIDNVKVTRLNTEGKYVSVKTDSTTILQENDLIFVKESLF